MTTPTASVFIATSLDGFIARSDGALDWLPGEDPDNPEEDFGYEDFINSVDTLVMGRHTFEAVLGFEEWPHPGQRVVVLSSRPVTIPAALRDEPIEVLSASPAEVMAHLADTGARHVYVDGGRTIQGFLRAGLIHELIITRVPVLLGAGIALFGELERDIALRHLQTRDFANGLVQSRYQLVNAGAS